MDSTPPAVVSERDGSGAVERIQKWLLNEVSGELEQPGNMTLTIHLDSSRQSIKAVMQRFVEL